MSAVVLTGENSTAFYEQKLAASRLEPVMAPEGEQAEESVEVVEDAPVEVDAAKPPQKTEPDKDEGKQKVHLRFSELTQRAKDAEAKAEAAQVKADSEARARALAEQEVGSLRAKYEPPKTDPLGPEPTRAQFINDEEFATALKEHTTEKVTRETEQRANDARVAKAFGERVTAFKALTPDYDAAIAASADLKVSEPVKLAILDSEQGPKILHHLAKNPDIVADLAAKSPEAQLRFIGKLEGRFENEAAKPPPKVEDKTVKVAATEISRAPAPITPLRGSSAVDEPVIDSSGEFHGTAKQWREGRKAGKIK